MKHITAKQYAKIHPYLPVQRGNVRISSIVFINALPYVLDNGCKRRALLESWDEPVANAPLAMDRAYEGEPENQMGKRPRTLQAAERGRTTVPKTQGPPAHL